MKGQKSGREEQRDQEPKSCITQPHRIIQINNRILPLVQRPQPWDAHGPAAQNTKKEPTKGQLSIAGYQKARTASVSTKF